jgi:hypothetical protein
MSDFGSGLGFGTGGPSSMPAITPMDSGPADTGPTADASPAPMASAAPQDTAPTPPSGPPAAAGPSFGSMLKSILPGPHYNAPDPQSAPLDQAADLLQQRVSRANQIATNPIAQFFAPQQVAAARAFVPQAAEQLQKIQAQKADIQAGRTQAQTLGLAPGEVSDQASQADRMEAAKAKALSGDMRAFQGIQAVDPTTAAAIAPQVHEVVAGHLANAQLAFDSLAGMTNQGQYAAKLNQLRQDGTLTDLEKLGLKTPETFDQFNNVKAAEGLALRNARVGIDTARQKLEDRNTYQPMSKDEAATYDGRLTTVYGDKATNGVWGRNASSGARGFINNGMATPDSLGKGGTLGNADQRKELGDEAKNAVPPADLEKYRAWNRIYQIGTTAPRDGLYDNGLNNGGKVRLKQGDALPQGTFNTNPNVQTGLAEGLASMLRGGRGGANPSLLNIESGKRAVVQTVLDKLKSNYAGGINTLTGEQIKPYLTNLTQQQIRDVMDGLKQYNDANIPDRMTSLAKRAGALGFDASALGLGNDESNGVIGSAIEEGRQAQIARMRPNFQAIGGGDGVLQLGAQRPGSGATGLPPGTQTTTQLPGAQPLMTPVQQSQNPTIQQPPTQGAQPSNSGPAPGGQPAPPPLSPQPSGAGAPVVIAGQQINAPQLPSGASPAYLQVAQRIESGGEKNPWTAGAKGTSAGGAYQFIKTTWDANKPPGAPARAADATPQQQTQAFEAFTAKNAVTLQGGNVPVNDTTLYMAHNLGAGGAVALLHTDQNADARTAVGETVARNNPLFFRGRPTVATVLQRYQDEVAKGGGSQNAQPPLTPMQREAAARRNGTASAAAGPTAGQQGKQWDETAQQWRDTGTAAVDHAPAIASTAGAVVGGLAAGPPGAVAGGAAGGGGGQAFKDYMQGNKQSPIEIAKQAVLGGVLGVSSEARPFLAAGARVLGAGAVTAGADAIQNGGSVDTVDAGVKGLAYGLGGEALGRFVSSAGATAYKALSRYTQTAQAELSAHAGQLAEARNVMATEKPQLPGDAGPNPKYEAAKVQADKATQAIKDHGQNPDDMVHAYEQAKAGVSAGEAAVMRPAAAEKSAVSAGYNDLRSQVAAEKSAVSAGYNDLRSQVADTAGNQVPKPNQPLPDGPVAQLRTADNPAGKVEAKFAPDAQNAELLIKAPAKDWGEKWQQLQNAGSELIQKRMAFLQNGDKPSADAMDNLFQGVRNQQAAAAKYVFGEKQGAAVISNLESLDQRYAKVMNATQGMDYKKMQSVLASGNTPESRALEQNFKEFAKGDPTAIRAFNAMKAGAKGSWKSEANLMVPIIAGEAAANAGGVPSLGAVSALVGGHRLYKLMQGYMNAKMLGRAVKFGDFVHEELSKGVAPGIVGNAVQRGAVMQQ